MGTDVLNIWYKTGTYKDIQDCEIEDILILSDGMILQVENNKKFALKIKAKVLKNKNSPKHIKYDVLLHHNMLNDFAKYI